ncbi:MAG: hypothetical protein ACI86M_003331, partial [Saprospiraceae bacterium]
LITYPQMTAHEDTPSSMIAYKAMGYKYE